MNIDILFEEMIEKGASDLHLATGIPPILRIIGELEMTEHPPIKEEDFSKLLDNILTEHQRKSL